ncbi:MAG: preprotein translocase subunit SecG [Candidatus Zixiibacteriota bacterium]|nr:MAG: preprotein translocase subunit SecG [candidate division Zixibacteria bacterium]
MFYAIFVFFYVIIAALLIGVILMQSSKGGGLAGSAFGGGPSMSFLGARGTATFLTRATSILAILFMLLSLGLSLMLRGAGPVSVTQQEMQQSGASNLPAIPPGTEVENPDVPITTPPGAPEQQQAQPEQQEAQPPAGGEQTPQQ